MGYTAPRTWVSGETVTASLMNTHLRDNMTYVHDMLQYSRCTSSLTKNANTTVADVTGLAFSVGVSDVWAFRFHILGDTSTAAGRRVALTGPASPTAIWYRSPSITDPGTTFGYEIFMQQEYEVFGLLRNGSNAGTVQFRMAQWNSDATNTTVLVDSYVLAWRVG